MSDTDSDLDFESADEDSEFASHLKKETTTPICDDRKTKHHTREDSEIALSGLTITPNLDLGNEEKTISQNKNGLRPETPDSSCNIILESNKETELSPDQLVLTINDTKEENDQTNKCELKNEPTPQDSESVEGSSQESQQKKPSKPLRLKNKKQESREEQTIPVVQDSNIRLPETVEACEVKCFDEDPPPEKQRVPLRLEKRKQESQRLKEASPVRESKSDLMNILEDSNKEKFSSWGFSSWGTTLLSTAASSVSSFSTQVSQGLGSVLETVESTLGAPSPEELAAALRERKDLGESVADENDSMTPDERTSLFSDVSSWTSKVFENTGSKVLMGGLDTLEMIGKRSMDILTVGDPGLRKKRSAFADGANLSEILREAKAKADEQGQLEDNPDAAHYSQVFDDRQGLVHLEALEMLSRRSQAKVQRLLLRHTRNADVRNRLEEIQAICENVPSLEDPTDCENFEDFESVFKKHALGLSLPLNLDSIVKMQRQINTCLNSYESASEDVQHSPKEIFQSAICSLAEFTAKCIEAFHKVAELVLVQSSADTDLENCATNLTGLTTVMCIETNNLSSRYHKCLDALGNSAEKSTSLDSDVTAMVTNLYVEAANSNKYIQDAYQMLIPVLQECLLGNLD